MIVTVANGTKSHRPIGSPVATTHPVPTPAKLKRTGANRGDFECNGDFSPAIQNQFNRGRFSAAPEIRDQACPKQGQRDANTDEEQKSLILLVVNV